MSTDKPKVVELHPVKEFSEDELQQMWKFFRTPSYTLVPENIAKQRKSPKRHK